MLTLYFLGHFIKYYSCISAAFMTTPTESLPVDPKISSLYFSEFSRSIHAELS